MNELTEMAGVAEAETQAAYAWALNYDDVDEFLTQPTQRLTSRRITALSLAASLTVIAVAGGVALGAGCQCRGERQSGAADARPREGVQAGIRRIVRGGLPGHRLGRPVLRGHHAGRGTGGKAMKRLIVSDLMALGLGMTP